MLTRIHMYLVSTVDISEKITLIPIDILPYIFFNKYSSWLIFFF